MSFTNEENRTPSRLEELGHSDPSERIKLTEMGLWNRFIWGKIMKK